MDKSGRNFGFVGRRVVGCSCCRSTVSIGAETRLVCCLSSSERSNNSVISLSCSAQDDFAKVRSWSNVDRNPRAPAQTITRRKASLGRRRSTRSGAPAEAPSPVGQRPRRAGAAAPAAGAPVPIPAAEPPPPEPPKSEWVANAESRKKIPYWVMPVLLFLPIWLIMYVGTLEAPTREEGVLFEGGEVYAANCASCHGAGGGGGVGPGFNGGAVIETFANFEDRSPGSCTAPRGTSMSAAKPTATPTSHSVAPAPTCLPSANRPRSVRDHVGHVL